MSGEVLELDAGGRSMLNIHSSLMVGRSVPSQFHTQIMRSSSEDIGNMVLQTKHIKFCNLPSDTNPGELGSQGSAGGSWMTCRHEAPLMPELPSLLKRVFP